MTTAPNEIRALHDAAMNWYDRSEMARFKGDVAESKSLLREALKYECDAAFAAMNNGRPEPTTSVLLRSAAQLAINVGDVALAERLACAGLSGSPPPEIADELRHAYEQANFDRHMRMDGIELTDNDFQLVLDGDAIAPGVASAREVFERIEALRQILVRASEFARGMPYRAKGPAPAEVAGSIGLFVGQSRAASYGLTIKVAGAVGQQEFGYSTTVGVMHSVLDRLELLEGNQEEALKREIGEPNYYRSFVGLAQHLAPDGKRVKLVGLSATRGNAVRAVRLTKRSRTEKLESLLPPLAAELVDSDAVVEGLIIDPGGGDPRMKIKMPDGSKRIVSASKSKVKEIIGPALEHSVFHFLARSSAGSIPHAEVIQLAHGNVQSSGLFKGFTGRVGGRSSEVGGRSSESGPSAKARTKKGRARR